MINGGVVAGARSIGRGAPLNAELTLIIQEYEDGRVVWLIRPSSVVARSTQQRQVADRLRELIEPLIPQRPARRGPGDCRRPRCARRDPVVLDTGCRWPDLPDELEEPTLKSWTC